MFVLASQKTTSRKCELEFIINAWIVERKKAASRQSAKKVLLNVYNEDIPN